MGMRRGVWGDGENENACPKFFGRRASVSGEQNRMGMQKFVSEDGSVGEKEAFIGDWAWNGTWER